MAEKIDKEGTQLYHSTSYRAVRITQTLQTEIDTPDLALKKLSIDLLSMDRCDRVLRAPDIAGTVAEWIPAPAKAAEKQLGLIRFYY